MRKKIKAKSVGLYFVLLLYADVIDFGKGHSPRAEVQHQGQLSPEGVKGGRFSSSLKFPKENHSQFHFQPLSYQETFEVIDEDKVQSSDIGPAEPVSASLVEIVEENSPNQAQKNDFKQPLQRKNSLHSSAILTFPQHKVHTLQTGHRKAVVKLKQKSARVYPFSNNSKIFTRVSIPGKHRIFNTSHEGNNWTKLLLSPKFTSLKLNTIKESALQLSSNINVTDEGKKRINQMERNQASSRDILEAFISRMGLNVGPGPQPEPSPLVDVTENLSHPRPSKAVLWNKGSTNLPPKKSSLEWTSHQRGYQNFYTARKPTILSRNSLQLPTVIKGVPLEKKEKTSLLEPEVFDSSPDKMFLNSRKNSTSNSGKNYVNNSPNLRFLNSLLRDKDAHFLDTTVTGRDKSGLRTSPVSQVSPISPSVNKTQKKGTTQQQKNNKSQDKSRNIVIGRNKSGLSETQTKGATPQLKENITDQHKNRTIVIGRDKSGLGTYPKGQVSPLSPSVNNTQTKATTPQLKKVLSLSASVNKTKTKATKPQLTKKSQDKSKNIVTGLDKSGLVTPSKGQVSPLSPSVNNTETNGTTQQHKSNKSQDKSGNIVRGRHKSGLSTRPKSQVSPISTSVNSIKTSTATTQQKKTQDKSRKFNSVTGSEKSLPTSKVSSLNPRVNNTKTNTTTTQLMNNKTQDKSGNIRDDPKIETNEKHFVNHNKSGSHNLVLAHARKNATHLHVNSTKLSIETTDPFTSSLDSNISLKHFSDLFNFFNSFNSSSDKKPTSKISTEGNSHVDNKFINGTRNRIVSENLLKILDFVHTKKTNYTASKRLKLGKGQAHSDHNSAEDQIKKQLQMSIYRGWNKASKGRRLGSKKLPTSLHPSVKNKLTNLHEKGNDGFAKGKGDNFELNVLQIMKNVSQKELLELESDIVNALSSTKLWNLQQRHENQTPGQQHHISPEGTKNEQLINRQHSKQEHSSEKQLNYQQLNKQGKILKQSNPKFGQEHNQSPKKSKSKQTKQQIVESNNRKQQLNQHELKSESKQSQLQQTNHTSHHVKKKNMSHSLESTSTVQNCSLLVSVNATKKSPNYGCNQTRSKLSPKNNGGKNFFSHSSNTSEAKTGALIKIAHTSHNVSSLQSPLTRHSSARKIPGNNVSPLRTGNGTFVTKPGFNVAKDVDVIKNISVQLDRDSTQEPMNTESISEGNAGSGIVELTEFVDQVPDKENVTTKWSEWTPCSKTCGDAKRKRIEYRCTSTSQEIRDCAVSGLQHESCVFKPCPVDGRFTTWTRWSTCSRSCGFKGFSVRSRSCTAPKYGGQPCYGAGIDSRECNRKHCPVDGGLSKWSKFGLCSKSCGGGVRMRHRECNNPVPRYGGTECDPADQFETQSCGNMKCPVKTLKRLQVADVDPKSLCDFNPCDEAGCLHDPAARCITDFECNPVFFNVDGDMLSNCKGMDSLFSRIPEVICSYNPCVSEKCWEIRDQCVVDLKCRPVFIGIDRRLIPPQCQVHATARVDRLRGDQTWTKFFPTSRPAPVNLASDLMPSFTRLWFPVASFNRVQQFERMTDVNKYPLGFSRTLNTSPTMANTMQSLEQQPVTEVFIEKVPNGNQADDDDNDDNDNADDNDDVDESNADEDDDDGNVFSDFDEDG